MSHSDNFIKVKRAYYRDCLPIKDVEVKVLVSEHKEEATIVFDDNGKDLVISGSDTDFVTLALHLRTSVRDGKQKVIDLSGAVSLSKYYENVKLFIPTGNKSLKSAIESLKQGKTNLPPDFDFEKAVVLALNGKLSNPLVKPLLDNYFEVLGALVLDLVPWYDVYTKIVNNQVKDKSRFEKYQAEVYSILKKNQARPPLIGYRELKEKWQVNLAFLLANFEGFVKRSDLSWGALYGKTGGVLEGSYGVAMVLDDYSKYYELAIELLRDLAFLYREPTDELNDSDQSILDNFNKWEFSHLVTSVDPSLRNASTHLSLDFSEKGIVEVWSDSKKNRKLLKKVTYEEVISKRDSIRDLCWSLLLSYLLFEKLSLIRAIDSPDFKFFVVENFE